MCAPARPSASLASQAPARPPWAARSSRSWRRPKASCCTAGSTPGSLPAPRCQPGPPPGQLARAALQPRPRDYQIVFQDPHSALDPRLRIIDSTLEPLQASGGKDRPARRRAALDALARVGLSEEMAQRYPHQLSGGQKQRANIARVLTLRPKVIVCDEVVAALDVSIRGAILNLFADLQREFGLTYVFITHDLSVVAHISDRIAVMYLGRFMELGPNQSLTRQPMHPYTAALLSAEPVALPAHLRALRPRRITLEGEMPSPIDPPSGCRLRTRCPWASARCAAEAPALRELRPQHWVACHWATAAGPPGAAWPRRGAGPARAAATPLGGLPLGNGGRAARRQRRRGRRLPSPRHHRPRHRSHRMGDSMSQRRDD